MVENIEVELEQPIKTEEVSLQDPGAQVGGITKPTDALASAPVDAAPNIIFIGTRHRNGGLERLEEAPLSLISAGTKFDDLPSSDEQLKGFYYERAAELCRAFPGLYKRLIKKGE